MTELLFFLFAFAVPGGSTVLTLDAVCNEIPACRRASEEGYKGYMKYNSDDGGWYE